MVTGRIVYLSGSQGLESVHEGDWPILGARAGLHATSARRRADVRGAGDSCFKANSVAPFHRLRQSRSPSDTCTNPRRLANEAASRREHSASICELELKMKMR
jgi:hypothetical protein